jgi:hypothetical protein
MDNTYSSGPGNRSKELKNTQETALQPPFVSLIFPGLLNP